MVRALASQQMWPGFDSWTRRHMWVEFVASLLSPRGFSPGSPGFLSLQNQVFKVNYIRIVSPSRLLAATLKSTFKKVTLFDSFLPNHLN